MAGHSDEEEPFLHFPNSLFKHQKPKNWHGRLSAFLRNVTGRKVLMMAGLGILVLVVISLIASFGHSERNQSLSCDSLDQGYHCRIRISHDWGQYSPYFKLSSEISPDVPTGCNVTFAQILSRHGARDPTSKKTLKYAKTMSRVQSSVQHFKGDYAFIAHYNYSLGADQLTAFGKQEMVHSGTGFFDRYESLARSCTPFFRASGERRVVESAQWFASGLHQAKVGSAGIEDKDYPYDVTVISEAKGSNNSLDHGLCTAFEASRVGKKAQKTYLATFVKPITDRLNSNLLGANLTAKETIYMMDLCPFNTVASDLGTPSPFCDLFSASEWQQYDYYQTLGKYYGFGPGNPLGPTQGVGYVNELIARMTGKPVVDQTSVNHTLDDNPDTFPLGKTLYADFGHDNGLTAVFSALGLYNSTPPLSQTKIMSIDQTKGYSAAWTVPFAARAVIEKMQCDGEEDESVRVLINGRVLPLESCGADTMGRCSIHDFLRSLSFAQGGGHWGECSVDGKILPSLDDGDQDEVGTSR